MELRVSEAVFSSRREPDHGGLDAKVVSAVIPLLEGVEELAPDASGALVLSPREERKGTVLVEEGRVCWVMAAGMSRRLTDLLRAESGITQEAIEEVYTVCRTRGQPLGEALVDRGIISPDGLRGALERHACESLIALARTYSGKTEWVPHRKRRYDAKFSFSPAEILVSVGATAVGNRLADAKRALERFSLDDNAVATFDRSVSDTGPFPVAGRRIEGRAVSGLLALGLWAREVVDLARTTSGGCELAAGFLNDGQAAVAWPEGEFLCAALCEDAIQFGRLLSKYGKSG
jgi:hypothetical protein